MKKIFTGLCMAWGNFCFIPGLKRWDENARALMLGWLPTVGLIIGVLWALVYFGAVYASLPYLLVVFVLTFMPFLLSGFIHVDGFMDTNDALLSRGTLEKKQAILKDSRCGTFAIITIIMTILCYYSCLGSSVSIGIDFVNLILLSVIPRSVAALEVLLSRPMEKSQYKQMHEKNHELLETVNTEEIEAYEAYDSEADDENEAFEKSEEGEIAEENDKHENADDENEAFEKSEEGEIPKENDKHENVEKPATVRQGVILLLIQLTIIVALCFLICSYYISTGVVLVASALGSAISAAIAKKGLNGMNGDIAGYCIIWGELTGIIALSVV